MKKYLKGIFKKSIPDGPLDWPKPLKKKTVAAMNWSNKIFKAIIASPVVFDQLVEDAKTWNFSQEQLAEKEYLLEYLKTCPWLERVNRSTSWSLCSAMSLVFLNWDTWLPKDFFRKRNVEWTFLEGSKAYRKKNGYESRERDKAWDHYHKDRIPIIQELVDSNKFYHKSWSTLKVGELHKYLTTAYPDKLADLPENTLRWRISLHIVKKQSSETFSSTVITQKCYDFIGNKIQDIFNRPYESYKKGYIVKWWSQWVKISATYLIDCVLDEYSLEGDFSYFYDYTKEEYINQSMRTQVKRYRNNNKLILKELRKKLDEEIELYWD